MRAETVWRSGRFGSSSGPEQLLFGRMYEDAAIEKAAFRGKRRVFCIASAGCTARHLSIDHEVIACDINPAQIAYAERRGRGALAETGAAERVMNLARFFAPLVGWRRSALRSFLDLSEPEEQVIFWREHLDTHRFRVAFDAMMSPAILRAAYSPVFLSFLPAQFGAVLRRRLERGFSSHANNINTYARALLLGESAIELLSRDNIHYVHNDAAAYLESCDTESFDAVALSNILDGASPAYCVRLLKAVRRATHPDGVIVSRSFAEPPVALDANWAERDRAMLWGIVTVSNMATLLAHDPYVHHVSRAARRHLLEAHATT